MSTAKELFAAWRRKHMRRFPFFIRSQPRTKEGDLSGIKKVSPWTIVKITELATRA